MHRRQSSSSTVRVAIDSQQEQLANSNAWPSLPIKALLWHHQDNFSQEQIVINPSLLEDTTIKEGDLIELAAYADSIEVQDFAASVDEKDNRGNESVSDLDLADIVHDPTAKCLCVVKLATAELVQNYPELEVSLTKTMADKFGFPPRIQVSLTRADFNKWRASHVELGFRDAYIARSDMWRMVYREIAGRTLYKGQKITFFGSLKVTVQAIHVRGHHLPIGYFSKTTVPIFRSEAARYVLFIQMSREMWDFDSEGNGEIMFSKVINGFLPDLFRRWAKIEVRHLVSIILFGRLEYDRYDFGEVAPSTGLLSQSSSASNMPTGYHQDFYRVVVTDMASAQWTTILNELKCDFRVFLRDMSLYTPDLSSASAQSGGSLAPKITGRPSTALKGNILEAINMASSQFANDYIDRDLIRTGVSTVIITAGTGVFDVDRDLLNLTSENLTNNGIGIDLVCLSRMPLHSVPLFRYPLSRSTNPSSAPSDHSNSPRVHNLGTIHPSLPNVGLSPAYSSFTSTSVNYFSRFPAAFPTKLPQYFGYGIPQWIDLSYWSDDTATKSSVSRRNLGPQAKQRYTRQKHSFIPRVRMYELQMMGLMELGMADISIPYLNEARGKPQKRRKRVHSDISQLQSVRSLSQSPTSVRKDKVRTVGSQGLLGSQARTLGNTFDKMDKYDEQVFRSYSESTTKPTKVRSTMRDWRSTTFSAQPASAVNSPRKVRPASKRRSPSPRSMKPIKPETTSISTDKTTVSPAAKQSKPPRINRTISYALRGLAPPIRSAASAELSVESVKALPILAKTSLAQAVATNTTARPGSVRSNDTDRVRHRDRDSDINSVLSADTTSETPSKPILIGNFAQQPLEHARSTKGHPLAREAKSQALGEEPSQQMEDGNYSAPSDDDLAGETKILDVTQGSIPRSDVPFVRNVNASNPLKKHPDAASAFGRWQHLYPHKPRSSTVKWRSLCTPASVPLTTYDFPSARELALEFVTKKHMISLKSINSTSYVPMSIDVVFQEMIALRLAHGYQVVVGELVSRAVGTDPCDDEAFLEPQNLGKNGNAIFMTMGSTIQSLLVTEGEHIEVTRYVRRTSQTESPSPHVYHYTSNIRTILSKEYYPRSSELTGFSEEYPWESADEYLAAGGADQDHKVQELRFWRARFVLLPVETPGVLYRPQQNSEETEEEIHLLGIRALTQAWQKARYFPSSERQTTQGRLGVAKRKDQNPLEVKFETLNPSEIVATELDKLLALEGSVEMQSTQLLPDSEKLDRETSMSKIAQAIQGEKGIEIKNRRWHFRLHYNCFNGEEFTNWLLHNVKNIETRDEAVEFGNELMKEGLFEHVNGKYNFKDGNYFYSMKPEFRTPKLDLKGSWFATGRRPDKSVPPTPLSDHPTRDVSLASTRSRSGSNLAFQLNSNTPSETSRLLDKNRKSVCLSKMIKVDVDPRKRSNRPEIINLHYDRFHNPENCYHIELSWLNVTSKLVDDAIISWTTLAERYGLKFVEVPIAEAYEIPKNEPFRRTYHIKLALAPPKRQGVGNVLTASSFTPQPNPSPDVHIYQKAILKRFNFVLDLEATSEFPDNVEIEYSWGKLTYQYTQFVHRSGIILAQITNEGDIILLANRLYNARFASSKEAAMKFDPRKETGPHSYRPVLPPNTQSQSHSQSQSSQTPAPAAPAIAPSGIIGVNSQSPGLMPLSPTVRATADVLGSKPAISSSALAQYVTPEQIKDDLEAFCSDPAKLEQFYKELIISPTLPLPSAGIGAGAGPPPPLSIATNALLYNSESRSRRTGGGGGGPTSGSTSSSLLKPIREPTGGVTDFEVPAFELPESAASPSALAGIGSGITYTMLRRARGSVMYDSVAEMFGSGSKEKERKVAVTTPGGGKTNEPAAEAGAKEESSGGGGGGGGGGDGSSGVGNNSSSSRVSSMRNSPAVFPMLMALHKDDETRSKGSGNASPVVKNEGVADSPKRKGSKS